MKTRESNCRRGLVAESRYRFVALPAFMAAVLVAGCGVADTMGPLGEVEVSHADFDLPDATPPASFFFFRAPIAQASAGARDFDAGLLPFLRVNICPDMDPACAVPFASFTKESSRGRSRIRLQGEEQYIVNWKTSSGHPEPGSVVEIRVVVSGLEIGSATVGLLGRKLDEGPASTADYVVTAGRTIPIKFRIEDNPFLRAWVLRHSLGFTSTQTAQAILDEFGINAATSASILHGVGYDEFDVGLAIKNVYGFDVDVLLALLISVDVLTPNFEPDVFVGARIGTELYGLEAAPLIALFTHVGLLDVSDPVQAGALAAKVLLDFFGPPPPSATASTHSAPPIPIEPISPQEAVDAIVGAGLELETAIIAVLLVFQDEINGSLEDLKHFIRQFKDLADLPAELIAFAEQIPELLGITPEEVQELIESAARSAAEAAGAVLKDVYDRAALIAADIMDDVEFAIIDVARTLKAVYEQTAGEIITIFVDIEKQAREIAVAIADQFEEIAADAYAALVKNLGFDPEELGKEVATFIMEGLDEAYQRTADQAAAILTELQFQATELMKGLDEAYQRTAEQAAAILADLEFQAKEVAEALKEVYDKIDAEVAQILKDVNYLASEVADALQGVFDRTAQQAAALLNQVGYTINQIADALKDVYNSAAQEVAGILRQLGYGANALIGMLQSVFNAGLDFIGNILESLGFDLCDIGIFSSLCDFLDDFFVPDQGRGTGR